MNISFPWDDDPSGDPGSTSGINVGRDSAELGERPTDQLEPKGIDVLRSPGVLVVPVALATRAGWPLRRLAPRAEPCRELGDRSLLQNRGESPFGLGGGALAVFVLGRSTAQRESPDTAIRE
jgi:hypothetical protein